MFITVGRFAPLCHEQGLEVWASTEQSWFRTTSFLRITGLLYSLLHSNSLNSKFRSVLVLSSDQPRFSPSYFAMLADQETR